MVTGAKVLPETLVKDNGVTIKLNITVRIKNLKLKNACICWKTSEYAKYWLREHRYRCGKGYIQTNEFYQTKESHIYAIGDVIGGLQLAHVASHEGIAAVEHIAGKKLHQLITLWYQNAYIAVQKLLLLA